jgi:hypothetical protein
MSRNRLLVLCLSIGLVGSGLISGCQKSADSGQITKEMFHPKANPEAQRKFDQERQDYATKHHLRM